MSEYRIPNAQKKLIAALFTDDTAIYMSYRDKLSDFEKVLSKWCAASKAKFNLKKTEILLIGEELYRRQVNSQGELTLMGMKLFWNIFG